MDFDDDNPDFYDLKLNGLISKMLTRCKYSLLRVYVVLEVGKSNLEYVSTRRRIVDGQRVLIIAERLDDRKITLVPGEKRTTTMLH